MYGCTIDTPASSQSVHKWHTLGTTTKLDIPYASCAENVQMGHSVYRPVNKYVLILSVLSIS